MLGAQDLLAARDDPLAARMLGPGGEPDLQCAWALLPPLVGPTFVGGSDVTTKPVVAPDGTVAGQITEPLDVAPGDLACHGDLIPACVVVGGLRRGQPVLRMILARQAATAETWWLEETDTVQAWRHDGQQASAVAPAEFDSVLDTVVRQQAAELDEAAEFTLPDLYKRCAQLSVLRALNGFVGRHPKYGWGGYEGPEHDAFPPTVLSLVHALLDVGLLGRAKELLGHWLATFVTADGAFDYYGPSLSEYGLMLDLGVRLARTTRDRGWWSEARPPLARIADRLLALRREADGLLAGTPEADYHAEPGVGQTAYYSNNLWCVRGLLTFADLLADDGEPYRQVARPWLADIRALLQADTTIQADGTVYLPPAAGAHTPPAHLTADRDASYANYRFYPEMLSSRLLPPGLATALLDYRRCHGGEIAGTTRFELGIDDWPAMEMGLAWLDHDQTAAAQRLLVGHMALTHAVGHQTAYEQVTIAADPRGWRRPMAGYCVPAQVLVPRLVRNLLVHESADGLWLNRAGFRSWLAEGYGVEQCPTRWGPISVHVHADGDETVAEVDAAGVHPEVAVRLRLQRADGQAISRLSINGQDVDAAQASLPLPRAGERLVIRAG